MEAKAVIGSKTVYKAGWGEWAYSLGVEHLPHTHTHKAPRFHPQQCRKKMKNKAKQQD